MDRGQLNLLTECRENNSRLGITGALFYKNGSFLQLIEGESRPFWPLQTIWDVHTLQSWLFGTDPEGRLSRLEMAFVIFPPNDQ